MCSDIKQMLLAKRVTYHITDKTDGRRKEPVGMLLRAYRYTYIHMHNSPCTYLFIPYQISSFFFFGWRLTRNPHTLLANFFHSIKCMKFLLQSYRRYTYICDVYLLIKICTLTERKKSRVILAERVPVC